MDQQHVPGRRPDGGCDAASHPVPATEAAGRRVLAYLRLLPMAEERRLELTLEVLRGLAASPADERTPARAMSLLRERLRKPEVRDALPTVPAPVCLPLMRGHMVPEEMDRRPWLSQAARLAQGYTRLTGRLSVLKPRVILPMLFAVLVLMHLLARKLS
ncbi:MAG: hypothetical protein R6W92_11640 [Desulfocurvibacter africanus]